MPEAPTPGGEPDQVPSWEQRDALTQVYGSASLCVSGQCDHLYDWQCAQHWHDQLQQTHIQQGQAGPTTAPTTQPALGSRRIVDQDTQAIRADIPTPVRRGLGRHVEAVEDTTVIQHPSLDAQADAGETTAPAEPAASAEPAEFLDEDGYPTDDALARLRTWDATPAQLVEFLDDLIGYGHLATSETHDSFGRACVEVTFVTGGWSGAESLLGVLEDTFFWFAYWQSSQRGGLVRFRVPTDQYQQPMPVLPTT